MKNAHYLSLVTLLYLFSSCQKDQPQLVITDPTDWLIETVTVKLAGQIVSAENELLSDATVYLEGEEAQTDANGYFQFNTRPLNRFGSSVRVAAPGYYTTTQLLYAEAAGQYFLNFVLNPLEIITSFDAIAGGNVQLEGVEISLPANSYINAAGQPYNGTVAVAAKWISTADPGQLAQLPGSSLAQRSDGAMASLLHTGVLAVELFDDAGNDLQLANGATATLKLPIETKWLSGSTEERPMWYLDEDSGRWIEDGKATRSGDSYTATVSHFTFWCCSPPYPAVYLTGQLQTADGAPVALRTVSMEVLETGFLQGGVRSNTEGHFGGFAPRDENLRMVIWDACHQEAFSSNVGSFSSNADLGSVTIDNDQYHRIRGQVQDCQLQPLENAVVTYRIGEYNRNSLTDAAGNYEGGFFWCEDLGQPPVESRAADLNAILVTDWLSQPMTPQIDFGVSVACDELTADFIKVSCLGETSIFLTPSAVSYYDGAGISVWDSLFVPGVFMEEFGIWSNATDFPTVGSQLTPDKAIFYFNLDDGTTWLLRCDVANCSEFNVTITENEGQNGYVGGVFQGLLYGSPRGSSQPIQALEVSGHFRVRQE